MRAGEIVGLLGPSGSGKSTLLNVVGCVTEPSDGWMRLDGEPVYDGAWLRRDLRRMRLEKIGFIFQFHNLLPFLDSTENVVEAMELFGTPARLARRTSEPRCSIISMSVIEDMQCRSSFLAARRSAWRLPGHWPTVRALSSPMNRPRRSTHSGVRVVMDLLHRVATDHEAAILVVTHDEKIFGNFDRLVRLRDGHIEAEGPMQPAVIDQSPFGSPRSI